MTYHKHFSAHKLIKLILLSETLTVNGSADAKLSTQLFNLLFVSSIAMTDICGGNQHPSDDFLKKFVDYNDNYNW